MENNIKTISDISPKVLVVEDEAALGKALSLKLKRVGIDSKTALDGEEALQLLQTEKFDLVTLDLVLPKVDGFEVLEQMAEWEMSTPVIVVSNLSLREDVTRVKELGAKEFFIKSNTSLSTLTQLIQKMLTGKDDENFKNSKLWI